MLANISHPANDDLHCSMSSCSSFSPELIGTGEDAEIGGCHIVANFSHIIVDFCTPVLTLSSSDYMALAVYDQTSKRSRSSGKLDVEESFVPAM